MYNQTPELNLEQNPVCTPSPEESPDDLQINHQIRVEAHLVA